ncbi:MAG TPA: beta-ketoacyl-[acyl-carrier-protein] synthase family protein [Polyangiaceae bacterium]|nr:beta-ketoacyl-[acyl-carrier-protein] synthase family protein [Polyangiaceae bacterium]
MSQRVAWVTGTGAVTCVGSGSAALWQAALEQRSGIEQGVGRVVRATAAAADSPALSFAKAAAREALQGAGWSSLEPGDGLIVATTTGHIPLWQRALPGFIRGRMSHDEFEPILRRQTLGSFLNDLRRDLGHTGPALVVSSSCAAGTQALGLAALWLKTGKVRRCLVGGAEVLCDLTLEGFRCLQLMTLRPSAPFDAGRSGIHLSEAAAFLCLESDPNVSPLGCISGFGFSTDAHHMTGPHPEGVGSFQAMTAALQSAGLSPEQVDWIHAHGTGSQQNDLAEGLAIARLFGGAARGPRVTSTKSVHGHALGASGALETVLCLEALRQQTVLPTAGLTQPDPRIDVRHVTQPERIPVRHILKNTLGFGGNNAALVISGAPPSPSLGGAA